jgi:hypothetical protein
LKVANADPGIFALTAIEALYAFSKGIPRIINVLGDNALLTAYALGKKNVDDSIIREVAEDLSLTSGPANVRPLQPSSLSRLNGTSGSSNPKVVDLPQPQYSQPDQRIALVNHRVNGRGDVKVAERFFRDLNRELIDAMGPMASIVLLDNIKRLGQSLANFPIKKLPVLIESVSSEILDHAIRQRFCKTAFERVRELGSD